MESEMTNIFVQGVGPEQEKLLNSSKTSKTLGIYYIIEFPVDKIVIFEKHNFFCTLDLKYFVFTKMLVISLSINRFPKIRILR